MRVPHLTTFKITVTTSSKQYFEKTEKSVISNLCLDHLSAFSSKAGEKCGHYLPGQIQTHTHTDRAHPSGQDI